MYSYVIIPDTGTTLGRFNSATLWSTARGGIFWNLIFYFVIIIRGCAPDD